MQHLKLKFEKEIKLKIENAVTTVIQGNLDPLNYARLCTEISVLRETLDLFNEIYSKAMKEENFNDND